MSYELRKRSTSADLAQYDLGADWVRANVDAAAATFVLGLATFGLRQMLDLPDPNAGAFAKALLALAEMLAAATGFAIYAVRTGAVLRRKLPDFPPLTWNALHILIGCGVGATVAFVELSAGPTTTRESVPISTILSIAVGGMMTGAAIGAVAGGMQALVLRKAARGVGDWLRWSALAGTTFGAYALALAIGSDQPLTDEVLTQLLGAAIAVAAGVVMLPALHRLQPL